MTKVNAGIAEAFDAMEPVYDEHVRRIGYFAPEWIDRHAGDFPGEGEFQVLDLGCGTGSNVEELCKRRGTVRAEGVDVSPKMIERARSTGRYEKLYTRDLNFALEIPSDTFDLVIAFGFSEWLTDLNTCLSEGHRVLKPGGALWASFRRFEAGDEGSPPRFFDTPCGRLSGHSAGEILHMMSRLKMSVTGLDAVTGYTTTAGFTCPYYIVRSRKEL